VRLFLDFLKHTYGHPGYWGDGDGRGDGG
jgi:hypothetical protein